VERSRNAAATPIRTHLFPPNFEARLISGGRVYNPQRVDHVELPTWSRELLIALAILDEVNWLCACVAGAGEFVDGQ